MNSTSFTKFYLPRWSWFVRSKMGYIFKFVSFSVVVVALSLFYLLDKHGFNGVDIKIIYTLLYGAIALETITLFMLIFSYWTVIALRVKDTKINSWMVTILGKYLKLKRPNWSVEDSSSNFLDWARRVIF